MIPDKLNFSLKANEITALADQLIEKTNAVHDEIASIPLEKVTWQNTIGALISCERKLEPEFASCYFPMYMSTASDVRDASSAANEKVEKNEVELSGRKDVYLRFKSLYDKEKESLNDLEKRLLEKTLEDYERQGVALEKSQFEKLQEIRKRLSTLSVQYQKNLNEDTTKLYFSKDELKGLPEDFIKNLPKGENDKLEVTLKYTDLFPILQFCSVPETRAAVDTANSSKCPENVALLEEALGLRRDAAKILGFESHSQFILKQRMAESPEKVESFLKDLSDRLTPKAQEERLALLQLKKDEGHADVDQLTHSEWRYYQNLRLKKDFSVDHNEIKQYFPLSKVTTELLDLYQNLFAVKFVQVKEGDEKFRVWHKDASQYECFDADSNEPLGTFYLDLHPRDGKYGHAAVFPLVGTCEDDDSKRVPCVAAMLANFTAPTAERGSILNHNEVVTFFHEFGHVIHGICSKSRFRKFSGTSVERDFVEAPSQMLENWCYVPKVLNQLSSHIETGEKIPNSMVEKLIAAKTADSGLFNKRQIFLATIDQTIHGKDAGFDKKTAELWKSLWTELTAIAPPPQGNPIANFGHLMGGYGAQYYGYLFSEVFSSDMFSKFESNPFDFALGKKYRTCVLEPGYTRDSKLSVAEFLGREPNNKAFLSHIGLKPDDK